MVTSSSCWRLVRKGHTWNFNRPYPQFATLYVGTLNALKAHERRLKEDRRAKRRGTKTSKSSDDSLSLTFRDTAVTTVSQPFRKLTASGIMNLHLWRVF